MLFRAKFWGLCWRLSLEKGATLFSIQFPRRWCLLIFPNISNLTTFFLKRHQRSLWCPKSNRIAHTWPLKRRNCKRWKTSSQSWKDLSLLCNSFSEVLKQYWCQARREKGEMFYSFLTQIFWVEVSQGDH